MQRWCFPTWFVMKSLIPVKAQPLGVISRRCARHARRTLLADSLGSFGHFRTCAVFLLPCAPLENHARNCRQLEALQIPRASDFQKRVCENRNGTGLKHVPSLPVLFLQCKAHLESRAKRACLCVCRVWGNSICFRESLFFKKSLHQPAESR